MREKITIYFPGNGTAVVRRPKDTIPDTDTVNRVAQILNEYKRLGHEKYFEGRLEENSET